MTAINLATCPTRHEPDVVAEVLDQHRRMDALCAMLERIADELPRACPTRCRRVSALLETFVAAHHRYEEPVLAELLAAEEISRGGALLSRIIAQHHEEEGLAQEILLALEPLCEGRAVKTPETLGYMLRCFFNNCRRSMLVEELALQAVLGGLPAPRRLPRAAPVQPD